MVQLPIASERVEESAELLEVSRYLRELSEERIYRSRQLIEVAKERMAEALHSAAD